ncbi:MAG: hydroxyphenylacetyl-CoA thioesterase PaaI [Acidocella sp.]|nr:hydroxyphenylacetyl-CoA thioesterase PaaI [Acidocella sp.]
MDAVTTNDDIALKVASHMRAAEGAHIAHGLTLQSAREGYARVALAVGADMLNSHGSLHGGVIFTLADTAFAYACNSRNESAVAAQASIVFVSPARAGEILVAEAVEQSLSGRSGVYHVTIRAPDDNARIVAIFQGLSRSTGKTII